MANVDPFLIVGIIIMVVIVFVINLYSLAYWQHPDDKNESYLARITILFGLQLSTMTVLMLPIDVANNGGDHSCDSSSNSHYCGGLDMQLCWKILFCMIGFFIVIPVPFASFYYEADDGSLMGTEPKSKFCSALKSEIAFLAVSLLVLLISYFTSAKTNIPVKQYSTDFSMLKSVPYNMTSLYQSPYDFISMDVTDSEVESFKFVATDELVSFNVDFIVYLISLSGWMGWWIFSFFSGVGLVTLPVDLILEFVWRPQKLPLDQMKQKELELQTRTKELIEIGTMLKKDHNEFMNSNATRKERAKRVVSDRLETNKLTQMVFILERDLKEYQDCKIADDEYNPLIPYFKLLVGSVFSIISILWLLQILLYMLIDPYASLFLNTYFMSFDTWFPMFGNLSYALFSLYLLACTMKGCFKLGMRMLCIKIHPMVPNGTYLNSLLFNLAVILLCTIPVVQFCTIAFADYARFSDIYQIFDVQISYLHFFTEFYEKKVFVYIIFITSMLTIVYILWKPRDTGASAEAMKDELQRRSVGL